MDETKYRCEECGEIFDNEVDWAQHQREIHSHYTCPNCHESFDEEKELEDHRFNVHPEPQRPPR